jgi:hypothetical protein
MRRLLVLLGIAAAVSSGAIAHADPAGSNSSLDASFLDSLTRAGITILDRAGAVKAGKTACAMMEQGRPEIDVVQLAMRQNPGLDITKAAKVTAIAASAYCPQYLQRASDGGNVNQPNQPDQPNQPPPN